MNQASDLTPQKSIVLGSLWSVSVLLIAISAIVAMPVRLSEQNSWALALVSVLLTVAALALFIMMCSTLRHEHAYSWDADFRQLPTHVSWPLRLGTWIGAALIIVANLTIILIGESGGSAPLENARFAMSLLAAVGAFVTFLTTGSVPEIAFVALFVLWGLIVVMALLRGIYGFFAGLIRRRKPSA